MIAPSEIKVHRKLLNLTQVSLASISGTTQSQISLMERGLISPTAETLAKITDYLVDKETFVIQEGNERKQVSILNTSIIDGRTVKFFDGGYIVIIKGELK